MLVTVFILFVSAFCLLLLYFFKIILSFFLSRWVLFGRWTWIVKLHAHVLLICGFWLQQLLPCLLQFLLCQYGCNFCVTYLISREIQRWLFTHIM